METLLRHVRRHRRHVSGGLSSVQLKDDPAVLLAAVDLARREVTCCAFFDFSIVVESTRSWLVIEVPTDGREILAGMAALLPSEGPSELRVPSDS